MTPRAALRLRARERPVLRQANVKLFVDKSFLAFRSNQDSATGEHQHEIDANQFAAALLMPEDLVRQEFEAIGFDFGEEGDLDALTRTFGGSRLAMSFRVAKLSL